MGQYVKKSDIIECVQVSEENMEELRLFVGEGNLKTTDDPLVFLVLCSICPMDVTYGDYVVKNRGGYIYAIYQKDFEKYFVKHESFEGNVFGMNKEFAIQWTGENREDVVNFLTSGKGSSSDFSNGLFIKKDGVKKKVEIGQFVTFGENEFVILDELK